MLNKVTLAQFIAQMVTMGKADVFRGDPTVEGGLVPIGVVQGEIKVKEKLTFNDLTFEEETGDSVHDSEVMDGGIEVEIPIILHAGAYDAFSPLGDGSGGGYSTPQRVVPGTYLIIPRREIGAELSYKSPDGIAAKAWSGPPPKHALWIWRGRGVGSDYSFQHKELGKTIRTLTVTSMYDAAMPEGHQHYTRGNPALYGIDITV